MKKPCSTTPGSATSAAARPLRIGDRAESAVENVVPAVGDENWPSRSRSRISPDRPSARPRRPAAARVEPSPNGSTSTGSGNRPSRRDPLRGVGDHDHPLRGRRDDLLAQQRAAAALDETQLAIDLVGAVDGQIEFGLSSSVVSGCPGLGLPARRLRGRHADDIEPCLDPRAERVDEQGARSSPYRARASCRGARSRAPFRRPRPCNSRAGRHDPLRSLAGRAKGRRRRRRPNGSRTKGNRGSADRAPPARPRRCAGPCAAR